MVRRLQIALVTVLLLLLALPASALAAKPGTGSTTPTTWNYAAMGDSLGTGFGALQGYVSRYAGHVGADNKVTVSLTNTSVNGWTSSDLVNAIKTDRGMRRAVSGAFVVTWDIGGNDLRAARTAYKNKTCGGADNQDCLRNTVATFQSNWNAIVAEIKTLRKGAATIYRTMDIYNPYVNEDTADGSYSVTRKYLEQINAHIHGQAATYGYQVAQVYSAFNGPSGDVDPGDKGYIFIDGLHPNDTGHTVIANLFRGLGYAATK